MRNHLRILYERIAYVPIVSCVLMAASAHLHTGDLIGSLYHNRHFRVFQAIF